MATVITPSMTENIVLKSFKYLVAAEIRKRSQLDFRSGCQEGLVASLSILFGHADELEAERIYNRGESWIHITEKITLQLDHWCAALENAAKQKDVDYPQMQKDVDAAVDKFALANPAMMFNALKGS